MPKKIIVPGVHDYIPPTGRVTVQVTDPDRPWRVRKEVKAENVIHNHWLKAANDGFRSFRNGKATSYSTDFSDIDGMTNPILSPNWASTLAGFSQDYYWSILGRFDYWPTWMNNDMWAWFWASDQDVTTGADRAWIPTNDTAGNVTGYASVTQAAGLSAEHLARGTVVSDESSVSWDRCRMVLEWGSSQGIGTYRTVGIGNINPRKTGNNCPPAPVILTKTNTTWNLNHPYTSYGTTLGRRTNNGQYNDIFVYDNEGIGFGDEVASMHWVDENTLYILFENGNIRCFDVQNWTDKYATTATGLVAGLCGVTYANGSVWLVDAGDATLRELDPATNSISVTNSYDLSGSTGGQTFFDITTDGTNLYILGQSSVHVVNTAGVYQSSWAHGLNISSGDSNPAIEWDPGMEHLWVTPRYTHGQTGGTYNGEYGMGWSSRGDSTWPDPDWRVHSFSTAGVAQPYRFYNHFIAGDNARPAGNQLTGMRPDGHVFWVGTRTLTAAMAPSAISSVNLGTDIEKTGSDALKVVYDYDFTA